MTEKDPKDAGPAQAFDSIEAVEEYFTKLLAETTTPNIRGMIEKALAHCADLKKARELNENILKRFGNDEETPRH